MLAKPVLKQKVRINLELHNVRLQDLASPYNQ
jgi:hypothetical protein